MKSDEFRRAEFFVCGNSRDRRAYMNTRTLLALLFACLSLISLLRVNPNWDTSESQLGHYPPGISEVGLRTKMEQYARH